MSGTSAAARFAAIARRYAADPQVREGRMFGSTGLSVRGKVFALLVRDQLVVKIPAGRVDALVASGVGTRFDPGHGKLMKEWAAIPVRGSRRWTALVAEGRAYVAGHARTGSDP